MVAHHRPGRLNRCGLRLSVEQLEKRLLLDGSPWQNPNDPLDVNADNRVSAVDVLFLINDLQANGARQLASPSPGNSPPPYIDVDGDGYAGPSDARRIIDELNGLGSSELPAGTLVGFRLSITDASGGVIDRVAVGTEFVLQVHVQDLRQSPETPRGVFAAYLDVEFDPPERGTPLPSQITYGALYPVLPYAEIGKGLVDEVGGAANGPLDGNEHLLFTLPFRAERQGRITFSASAADVAPSHDVILSGISPAVPASQIDYGTNITVDVFTTHPWQNPQNPLDINDDGLVTPQADVLRVINELNLRTIIGELGTLPVPPTPPHVPPPYYDVNGDDLLTPQADVLPVLNYLNSRPYGEGEGPGEVAVTPIAVRRPSYGLAPGTPEDRSRDACHIRPSSDATLDTGWYPQEMSPATAAQDLGYPAWDDRSADRPAGDLDEVFGTDIADLVLDLSQFGMF